MKLAAYGILADGVGSGAGTFPKLLRAMLERGHSVDFYGMQGFNHPRSLETHERYRFFQVNVPTLERLTARVAARGSSVPIALVTQAAHLGYQRETLRRIEAEHRTKRYDLVVCTDAQALCRSELPLLCWPQSPPHTEAAALRTPAVARAVLRNRGLTHFASLQLFYAYRWVLARAALDATDLFVCGSRWARDEWANFGAPREALRTSAYPIDLDSYANVPPLSSSRTALTLLWLGRATPRKRLDLFLAAFALLHARRPEVRARLVGNLSNDPYAARLLAPYESHPGMTIERATSHREIASLFGTVDVLVQPSQNENFGFSVAEALSAGRAVVLGPTNGTADYTGDAGFVFAEYRPEALADAMARALSAVERDGPALSARAREAARSHFDIDRIASSFAELCAEAISRREARARGRPNATVLHTS